LNSTNRIGKSGIRTFACLSFEWIVVQAYDYQYGLQLAAQKTGEKMETDEKYEGAQEWHRR
jgi:hypothetical protein